MRNKFSPGCTTWVLSPEGAVVGIAVGAAVGTVVGTGVQVQLQAQAGLLRQVHIPLGVDADGLGEDEVAGLGRPARRVVGELDVGHAR